MKTPLAILLTVSMLIACSTNDRINGYWTVKSTFYKATYLIGQFNHQKGALIVSYNDGTTAYTKETRPNQYVFKNLIKKEEGYVDAISGATKTTSNKPLDHLQLIHEDTLEVITYLFGKPLKELWIRTTELN